MSNVDASSSARGVVMRTILLLLLLVIGINSSELPTGNNLSVPGARRLGPEQYYNMGWDCMPANIRAAWGTLGYTESIWCNSLGSFTDTYNWFDFNAEQKRAAELIGYTEAIWCQGKCDIEYPFSKYYIMKWNQLPSNIRNLYTTLLYNQASWENEAVKSPIENYDWYELNPQQMAAAKSLKYTRDIWCKNGCTPEKPFTKYYSMFWNDLPANIRNQFVILLYTEQGWNAGTTGAIDGVDWYDMSAQQRTAATTLGYTEAIWCTKEGVWDCAPTSIPAKVSTPNPTRFPTRVPTPFPTKVPTRFVRSNRYVMTFCSMNSFIHASYASRPVFQPEFPFQFLPRCSHPIPHVFRPVFQPRFLPRCPHDL